MFLSYISDYLRTLHACPKTITRILLFVLGSIWHEIQLRIDSTAGMAFFLIPQSIWYLVLLIITASLVTPSISSELGNLQAPFSYRHDGVFDVIDYSNGPNRPIEMKYQQSPFVKFLASTKSLKLIRY